MKDFIEIERKFIIRKPEREVLLNQPFAESTSIVQIYLSAPKGVTRRIRSRSYNSCVRYFETFKKRIDKMSTFEDEKEILQEELVRKSKEIKENSSPIIKERISFAYEGKTIEIDFYPQWKNTAIMEIELTSCDEDVKIPEFIDVIKEVTGVKSYSNAAMSTNFPPEEK